MEKLVLTKVADNKRQQKSQHCKWKDGAEKVKEKNEKKLEIDAAKCVKFINVFAVGVASVINHQQ